MSQVNVDSLRNVYRRKDLIITYGCRKGMWHPGGKYRVKKKGKWVVSEGRCDKGGIRAVRIMKPKSKVLKSRHRRDYECRKG